MTLDELARSIDATTARAFVAATRHVIDALLIEAARVRQTQTPALRDYESAALPSDTPPDGWIGHEELRRTTQQMSEALAAEKWGEGVLFAIRALGALGAL